MERSGYPRLLHSTEPLNQSRADLGDPERGEARLHQSRAFGGTGELPRYLAGCRSGNWAQRPWGRVAPEGTGGDDRGGARLQQRRPVRGELFIVTVIIAWTYLLHAWFKKQGIDYRHTVNENGKNVVAKTANGEDKYWELGHCLKYAKCPLEKGIINNLNFLLELRHEIEHRSTTRIDDLIGPKLQACCINFNDTIKKHFGPQYGLERRLPIALQFVTFGPDQRAVLKKVSTLPRHIEMMMDNFDKHLTSEELADPRFRFQVAFVQRTANRPSSADQAIEFVVAGTDEAKEIDRILLKEVEKKKYLPSEIVRMMKAEGFRKFNMHHHTLLWRKLDAKKKEKGYGAIAIGGLWGWYENWVVRVREECNAHSDNYF